MLFWGIRRIQRRLVSSMKRGLEFYELPNFDYNCNGIRIILRDAHLMNGHTLSGDLTITDSTGKVHVYRDATLAYVSSNGIEFPYTIEKIPGIIEFEEPIREYVGKAKN